MAAVLEFSFRNQPAGCFEGPACPSTAGRYRYQPYRGPGHYELGKALAHGPARCSFVDGGSVVEFVVGSIPELHVVQIDEILDG